MFGRLKVWQQDEQAEGRLTRPIAVPKHGEGKRSSADENDLAAELFGCARFWAVNSP